MVGFCDDIVAEPARPESIAANKRIGSFNAFDADHVVGSGIPWSRRTRGLAAHSATQMHNGVSGRVVD